MALVNAVDGLFTTWPFIHSRPVPSMNCLSCEATLPKRVGVPNAYASAQIRSSCEATGTVFRTDSRCSRQAGFWSMASSGAISATRRRRTSAPAFSAPSATACASLCTLPVAE